MPRTANSGRRIARSAGEQPAIRLADIRIAKCGLGADPSRNRRRRRAGAPKKHPRRWPDAGRVPLAAVFVVMLDPPSGSWAGSLARPCGPVAPIFVKLCKSRLQGARGRRAVDVSGACRRLVHEPTSPRHPKFGPTCLSEERRQRH